MSNYEYKLGIREISWFGGGYEDACRKMVVAGMDWWDTNPDANVSYAQYENVTGLTVNESDDCKLLQKHMNEAIGNESSGAMMQTCLNHLTFAHKNGWEKYMEEMQEKNKQLTHNHERSRMRSNS